MDEELALQLTKLDKKLDKLMNLETRIAKALRVIPMSQKEALKQAREFAEAQRVERLAYDQVDADKPAVDYSSFSGQFDFNVGTPFNDVLGDDWMETLTDTEV